MQTIALAAAKGGVGKTTLAASLAVAAHLAHKQAPVAMIDLDPQGSLTSWWNLRPGSEPRLVDLAGGRLGSAQADLRRAGVRLLFLDCPPGFSTILSDAVAAADLVVVPTGASDLDLQAVGATAAMATAAGVPWCYALNRAAYRSRIAGRTVRAARHRRRAAGGAPPRGGRRGDGARPHRAGAPAGRRGRRRADGAVAGGAGHGGPSAAAALAPFRALDDEVRSVGLMAGLRMSLKGRATPPPEPAVRSRQRRDGRRVGAYLPTGLYVAFKAYVARTGATGEQAIVAAIERLVGDR